MREETEYAINKLENALSKLREGTLQAKDELDKDGVIQRFEFTFELLWKALRIFLSVEGIECKTPRSCLTEAFRVEFIENEKVFLDMLEDRNKTSHIYSQEISEEIFERIKNMYILSMEKTVNKLSQILK